jgi:2-dehydropantoate 2-reductase
LAIEPVAFFRCAGLKRTCFIQHSRDARAKGVAFPADARDQIAQITAHLPPAMKASMALDLDRGNRLEVPWLSGKVAELGRQLGIPTPTHSMIYAMLKPYVMGAKG